MKQIEHPPDPRRIDALREEIEADLESLRGVDDSTGPTLDTLASKLEELISIAKALEARDQQVSPKVKVALWHLAARVTTELMKRIVSATHFCPRVARQEARIERHADAQRTHPRTSYPPGPAREWRQTEGSRSRARREPHVRIPPGGGPSRTVRPALEDDLIYSQRTTGSIPSPCVMDRHAGTGPRAISTAVRRLGRSRGGHGFTVGRGRRNVEWRASAD